jgi:hypothetical protein
MNPASTESNLLIHAAIDSLPIKAITSNAFINNNLIESVCFDENSQLEAIGISAFKNNSLLRFVFFPNSLISIGAEAFRGCTLMHQIYIPASVQEEALTAFNDIPNFYKYSASDVSAMYYNEEFVYYLDENAQAILVDVLSPALQKNLIIPATVDQYVVGGFSRFYIRNNQELETIHISDDVSFDTLPGSFVYNNQNLTKIYIPLSITTIEDFGLYNAINLTIYTAYSSLPNGWGWNWKGSTNQVVFSVNGFN